jgi:hypothetical protein
LDALADRVLPLAGPRTPEQLAAAGRLLAELVRRLNHATLTTTIDHPAQLDAVIGHLHTAADRLPQMCNQLAGLLGRFDQAPGLYTDTAAGQADPGEVIAAARGRLGYAAHVCDQVAEALGMARNLTARLGIHADEGKPR